jgi:hypothetical protein
MYIPKSFSTILAEVVMDKKLVGIVKVSPVPEPMTSLLSGLGLVGFAGMRRVNRLSS